MSASFTVACVQNRATRDPAQSIAECESLTRKARAAGADLICLPEFCTCLDLVEGRLEVGAFPEATHPGLASLSALARDLEVWLLIGSLAVRAPGDRARNRSLLVDPAGAVVARYDKIHLFDVELSATESYRESERLDGGEQAVLAATPWGPLGLSICYDLRFAYLYRALAQAGACFLSVPAAFTRTTGRAHWHVLVRARAIETGSYVFAPSQYGDHGDARTYGHSLVVDPWGQVLADAGAGPGYALAEVDPQRVSDARRRIPALSHDRPLTVARG